MRRIKKGELASELFNPGTGAVLVFLRRPAANAAGTDKGTIAEDRHGALAIEHVVAFSRCNTAQGRVLRTWRQIAAGAAKGSRGHGLALAAEGASPHGTIHALKGKQSSAGIADGDIHLGAHLVSLLDGAGDNTIGICKGEDHEVGPLLGGELGKFYLGIGIRERMCSLKVGDARWSIYACSCSAVCQLAAAVSRPR